MGHQIVKQPNGLYAIWSTVVDSFIMFDATVEDVIEEEQVEMHERIAQRVRDTVARLERGDTLDTDRTFDECVDAIRAIHGDKADVLKSLRDAGLI